MLKITLILFYLLSGLFASGPSYKALYERIQKNPKCWQEDPNFPGEKKITPQCQRQLESLYNEEKSQQARRQTEIQFDSNCYEAVGGAGQVLKTVAIRNSSGAVLRLEDQRLKQACFDQAQAIEAISPEAISAGFKRKVRISATNTEPQISWRDSYGRVISDLQVRQLSPASGQSVAAAPAAAAPAPALAARPASADEVRRAVEQVASMNQAIGSLATPTVPCLSCSLSAGAPSEPVSGSVQNRYYENSCSADRNYLSSILEGQGLKQVASEMDIGLETCVRESMNSHGGPFRTCAADGRSLDPRAMPKACMNQDYVQSAAASFDVATKCLSEYYTGKSDEKTLEITRKNLLSLLSFESGFHRNAVSPTGSIGIGQFTSSTVDGLNSLEWNGLDQFIKSSGNAHCKIMAQQNFTKFENVHRFRCQMISSESGNPMKGMAYVFALLKNNRQPLEQSLLRTQRILSAEAQAALNDSEFKEKLLSSVLIWAHNTGIGGIRSPFQNLLSSQRGQAFIKNKDLNGFMSALAPIISEYHRTTLLGCEAKEGASLNHCNARVNEVTRFYSNIKARQSVVDQRAGGAGKCGLSL